MTEAIRSQTIFKCRRFTVAGVPCTARVSVAQGLRHLALPNRHRWHRWHKLLEIGQAIARRRMGPSQRPLMTVRSLSLNIDPTVSKKISLTKTYAVSECIRALWLVVFFFFCQGDIATFVSTVQASLGKAFGLETKP